ncbi:MAG: GH3 auxin-responsive promoter family protein [Bacteroidia bacterium]|nr:GH3 auxin-responsive promoter family protein [Bacteroidia bacterium]
MSIINSIAGWIMRKRIHQMELFLKYPHEVQREWLNKILQKAENTEYGIRYKFSTIKNYEDFRKKVPLTDYEKLKPYIERMRKGEQDILWPGQIQWFAKSSGTTDKSKFLPVSPEHLEECHYRGGRDMVTLYCELYPDNYLFTGKNLALGGSFQEYNTGGYVSYHGDVSAIIMRNLPMWAEYFRAPSLDIALMDEWESKLESMAVAIKDKTITSLAGVPSWMLVLLNKVLQLSGKKNIYEVWPQLEVYFHGGVNISPFMASFEELWGERPLRLMQIYNASEGFFGIQDTKDSDDMLLMLDYGVFYEFIPQKYIHSDIKETIPLEDVREGHSYALVISTNAGLWRYQLGDVVEFTSVRPYRIRVKGRTKHFINRFGEELMVHNADEALKEACLKNHSILKEYTAAPEMLPDGTGYHHWAIEFVRPPENLAYFIKVLDEELKKLNSDYEAKRYKNFVLHEPRITCLPPGTFEKWLQSKNKLGGQHKVPRLSNELSFLHEILLISEI